MKSAQHFFFDKPELKIIIGEKEYTLLETGSKAKDTFVQCQNCAFSTSHGCTCPPEFARICGSVFLRGNYWEQTLPLRQEPDITPETMRKANEEYQNNDKHQPIN